MEANIEVIAADEKKNQYNYLENDVDSQRDTLSLLIMYCLTLSFKLSPSAWNTRQSWWMQWLQAHGSVIYSSDKAHTELQKTSGSPTTDPVV